MAKFPWKKLSGLTGARRKIAKASGIPTTRAGRQRKMGRMMGCGCCVSLIAGAGMFAALALAQKERPLNLKTAPGVAVVEALRFVGAEIQQAGKAQISVMVDGEDKPRTIRVGSFQVFEQARVTGKPLEFIKKPDLKDGQAVRIAKHGTAFLLMIPKPPEPPEKPVTREPVELRRIPELAEVASVLLLDTKEKRKYFQLLDEGRQIGLRIIAGNIAKLPEMVPADEVDDLWFCLNLYGDMFDKTKLQAWLRARADANGIAKVFAILKTPEEKRDEAKLEFGRLNRLQSELAIEIAERYGNKLSMVDEERGFIRTHAAIFETE